MFARVPPVNVNVRVVERRPEDVPAADVFEFLERPGAVFVVAAILSLPPGPVLDGAVNSFCAAAVATLLFRIEVTPCEN